MRTLKKLLFIRERSRTTRLTQAGIWLAFLAFVAIGATISMQAQSQAAASHTVLISTPSHQSSPSLTKTSSAHSTNPATKAVSGNTPQGVDQPIPLADGNTVANPTAQPAKGLTGPPGYYYSDAGNNSNFINLLPAFRWTGATGSLYSNYGDNFLGGDVITASAITAIASIIFLLSSFIWWLLLEIIKFGLTANLVLDAAHAINGGFATLANTLGSSGIIWIMVLIAGGVGLKMLLKRRLSHVMSMALGFILPIAAVMALASFADPTGACLKSNNSQACSGINTNGTPSSQAGYGEGAKGSPAWLALQGDTYVNTLVGYVATGFTSLSATNPASLANGSSSTAASSAPTCNAYIGALYEQYNDFNNQANGPNSNMATIPTISYLWQSAYLNFWNQAQFGSSEYASLASCHVLEDNNNTPVGEQYAIMQIAYPKAITTQNPSTNFKSINPSRDPIALSGGDGSADKNYDTEVFGWDACQYSGGTWGFRPGWATLNAGSENGSTQGSSTCANWWAGNYGSGGTDTNFQWNTLASLQGAATGPPQNGDTEAQIQQAASIPYSFWGHNVGQRMLSSLMAGIVSVIYLWALGPLALGSALAQIGLVMMLILLPATLFFLAFPTDPVNRSRAGPSGIGGRMLRITGGFFLAKFATLLVITLLLAMITVMENAISGFSGLGTFAQLFIPIAALMVLRLLLKKAGMGNITSLSGALALPTAGAMAVAGEQGMARLVQEKASKIGDKTGLNKLDRAGKRTARLPVTAAKATARTAKAGAKLTAKLGTDVAIGAATGGTGLLASQARGAAVKGIATSVLNSGKNPQERLSALQKTTTLAAGATGKGLMGSALQQGLGAASGGRAIGALARFNQANLGADTMPRLGAYSTKAINGPNTAAPAALSSVAALSPMIIPTRAGLPRELAAASTVTNNYSNQTINNPTPSFVTTTTAPGSTLVSMATQPPSIWANATPASAINAPSRTREFEAVAYAANALNAAADQLNTSGRRQDNAAASLAGSAAAQVRAAHATETTAGQLHNAADGLPKGNWQ